jgi:hypothetical protein
MSATNPPTKQVIVSLTENDVRNLEFVMSSTGLNGTDSIRQALATEVTFQRWLDAGCKLLTRNGQTGEIHEVVFVG